MSAAVIGCAVLLLVGTALVLWVAFCWPESEDLGRVSQGWVRRTRREEGRRG